MAGFMAIPFGKRRQPEVWLAECPAGDYAEELLLYKGDTPDSTAAGAPDGLRAVAALPCRCPACGARLKCRRLPLYT